MQHIHLFVSGPFSHSNFAAIVAAMKSIGIRIKLAPAIPLPPSN
jgi:hypothetical protein